MSTNLPKLISDSKHFNVDSAAPRSPFIIGVAGGAASGKKTVCHMIMEQLSSVAKVAKIAHLSLNDFYRALTDEERARAEQGDFNFDDPSAFDLALLEK